MQKRGQDWTSALARDRNECEIESAVKKALILGTLSPQADGIRYLKNNGWWVIGCGHRPQGRGMELIDQFEQVDLRDLATIEALARREKVDLLYSVASEMALPALAIVPPKLGLPLVVPLHVVELTQNKVRLREFLANHGISPVKFRQVHSETDLEGWDTFPAIVKPVDSAGQRGVFRADSPEEIRARLERTLGFSSSRTAIIEEFLDGPEVSANAFVIDSQVVFNEISDRLVLENYPGGIPRGHVFPSQACVGETLTKTKQMVEHCIHALGIENGPIYFQMKLTSKGPRIVEVMPRLDGCHIWRLIKTVIGVDLLEASFRLLLGDRDVDLQPRPAKTFCQLTFFLSPPGQIFHEADHPVPPGASYWEYRYRDGEEVRPVNGFMEVVGYYIAEKVS
jgi:predicted ATP-grasp superfamily ATP-dependent carboligase